MTAQPWNAIAHHVDLAGDVHYVRFDGGDDADPLPPVVLVHGLGGSHLNWVLLGPLLATGNRVYALDLPGFGLSYPAGRRADVTRNGLVLDAFLREVVGAPALLVGNSMGGLLSMAQAVRRPDSVTGLVLVDPVLPRAKDAPWDRQVGAAFLTYAVPGLGERYLARRRRLLPPRRTVMETLATVCADYRTLPEAFVEASVALAERRAAEASPVRLLDAAYLQAARSLLRMAGRRASYAAMMRAIDVPVLLVHGAKDRLVPVQSARAAAAHCPHWRYEELPDLGHVPQIEEPATVARLISEWLGARPIAAP
ncbi:MAG TPA: alpha/beta fold hydrolase [Micromonosporaceae bacterium]|nr:alpha/beta fold hydrolase [Micromonosporaceae bacterium]